MTEPRPSGAPRVTLMRRWRLRPWKQARILAGNLDACRLGIERQGAEIARLREQNEQMRRENTLAAGASPIARPVGWEQPAGAVTPDFALLGYRRGDQPGYRVYASRELAGSVIEASGQDSDARFRAHLVLGRMVALNAASRPEAFGTLDKLWASQDVSR